MKNIKIKYLFQILYKEAKKKTKKQKLRPIIFEAKHLSFYTI